MPKCLCDSTSTILWFRIKIGGCRSLFVLGEINNDLVLEGLKVTSHLAEKFYQEHY